MIIQDCACIPVNLPLIRNISHSQREYSKSESIIVGLKVDNVSGFGEGCPRYYVTGESLNSALSLFEEVIKKKLVGYHLEHPEEVSRYISSFLRYNTALKAAIEIALFDTVGKIRKIPIYKFFGEKLKKEVHYIGGVPFLDSLEDTLTIIEGLNKKGINYFKIKVGKNHPKIDIQRVRTIRNTFPKIKIKIDANCGWTKEEAIKAIKEMSRYQIELVEEPIVPHSFIDLKKLAQAVDVPIMVDESLVSFNDAVLLIKLKACKWFNIRVSKNGGLIESKKIYDLAFENGIKIQLGSHYAETGILEMAKRHLIAVLPGVETFEGGTNMILKEDVTQKRVLTEDKRASFTKFNVGLGIEVKNKYNPFVAK